MVKETMTLSAALTQKKLLGLPMVNIANVTLI